MGMRAVSGWLAGGGGWRRWGVWVMALALVGCGGQGQRPVAAGGELGAVVGNKPAPAPKPATAPPPPPKPAPIVVGAAKPPEREPPAGAAPGAPTSTPVVLPRFPWPPPKASASQEIPDKWLRNKAETSLGEVADKLEKAMLLAEHGEWSYYAVPGGFALATHLEQIRKDGSPLPGADRWKLGAPSLASLSLTDFVAALARAPEGQYRTIVFVVSNAPWRQSATAPTAQEIQGFATGGGAGLYGALRAQPYGAAHQCVALVYQFSKAGGKPARILQPSPVGGQGHLEKSGLWRPLSLL